jgi:putative cardiolipin synthase
MACIHSNGSVGFHPRMAWIYHRGMSLPTPLWRRLLRVAAIVIAALLLLVLSGLLLADHLTPQAHGAPSQVLPLQPAQTRIDQQIVPLQEAHPGQSGVAFLSDGMDAFAARADHHLRRPQPGPAVLHLARRPDRPPDGQGAV